MISIRQFAKFITKCGDQVSPTDIEEGMRVGVEMQKMRIMIPLAPPIEAAVSLMQIEEKPDVTYKDIGGCKEQIEKIREVVELPMIHVFYYLSYAFLA